MKLADGSLLESTDVSVPRAGTSQKGQIKKKYFLAQFCLFSVLFLLAIDIEDKDDTFINKLGEGTTSFAVLTMSRQINIQVPWPLSSHKH